MLTSLSLLGHTVVPATIPIGTILYHGRMDDRVPDVPEWLAFDFDHAYVFCFTASPCYVISLQAKRDLRLLYFDGSSAAKMTDGPMDSQDVVAWGKPEPEKYVSEFERINALCNWGKPFGLDGFVRMVYHLCVSAVADYTVVLRLMVRLYDSEVMLCDPLDGLDVVTLLDLLPQNLTKPISGRIPNWPGPQPPSTQPELPPGWHGSLRGNVDVLFGAHVAGSWHDHAPGETRVHVDYAALITFYDPTLSSLVEARQGKDKLHHRLEGISPEDVERVHAELRSVLTRKQGIGSGVDWGSITHIITERYADRLEYLSILLSPTAKFSDAAGQAAAVRAQLLVMLVPYITPEDVPQQLPASANLSWAAPVVRRCATTQTSRIPLGMLTPQELRIHAAVEGTLREICRRLTLVWLEFFDIEEKSEADAVKAIEVGRGHVDELMSWLDWSVWVRCEPACSLGVRDSITKFLHRS